MCITSWYILSAPGEKVNKIAWVSPGSNSHKGFSMVKGPCGSSSDDVISTSWSEIFSIIIVFLTVVPTGCDSKSSEVLPIFSSFESFDWSWSTGRESAFSASFLTSSPAWEPYYRISLKMTILSFWQEKITGGLEKSGKFPRKICPDFSNPPCTFQNEQ